MSLRRWPAWHLVLHTAQTPSPSFWLHVLHVYQYCFAYSFPVALKVHTPAVMQLATVGFAGAAGVGAGVGAPRRREPAKSNQKVLSEVNRARSKSKKTRREE